MMMMRLLIWAQRRSLLTVLMVSNNGNSFTFYVMCLVGLREITKELLFTVNIILLILMLISHICKDKLFFDAPGSHVV
jgi:hypothetical protein